MAVAEHYAVVKPAFTELLELLSHCGEVASFFVKTKRLWPEFNADNPLPYLFTTEAFQTQAGILGNIATDPGPVSKLNRLEFEGSLVSVALAAGCHGWAKALPQERIRAVVIAGLAAVFPEPFDQISVYRLDDETWCEFTDEATISRSYVTYEAARGLWWMLSIADYD